MTKIRYLLLVLVLASLAYAQDATRQDALDAIQMAEQDIAEMQEEGFFTAHVNDTLMQAKQALERADFAETLRNDAKGELAEQAKAALEGLNYQGFTYDLVLDYTAQISLRKKQAYNLSDSLRAFELEAEPYIEKAKAPPGNIITGFFIAKDSETEIVNISETEKILAEAKEAFEKERYSEANEKLLEAQKDLEEKKRELATVNVLLTSGKNFFLKNLPDLLIISLVLGVAAWFISGKVRTIKTHNKLKDLETEQKALISLIKKAQIERFKQGKISNIVYRVRMEQYSKKLNENKQNIPVLKNMLKGK